MKTLEKSTQSTPSPWTGMVQVDDTALYVTDTGGPGPTIIYLNGSYGTQRDWRPVIAELGPDWRHISYDERARGRRSKRSADYSFESCVRDLNAVIKATGAERPLLVGWSYGAYVAVHWADRNPGCAGVVAVDSAVPWGLTGKKNRDRIRHLFRKMRLLFPLASLLGLTARMTADQHADINIEINEVAAASEPVLLRLTCPVLYVLATDGSLGGEKEEMEEMRASLNPLLARNPNLKVSAKVASNHTQILRKDFRAVAKAVRELATIVYGQKNPS